MPAHLRLWLQTPPNFHGPPREEGKNENCGGRVQKNAKFWAPLRGPTHSPPTPHMWPSAVMAKFGLAAVKQGWPNQVWPNAVATACGSPFGWASAT